MQKSLLLHGAAAETAALQIHKSETRAEYGQMDYLASAILLAVVVAVLLAMRGCNKEGRQRGAAAVKRLA